MYTDVVKLQIKEKQIACRLFITTSISITSSTVNLRLEKSWRGFRRTSCSYSYINFLTPLKILRRIRSDIVSAINPLEQK